MSNPSRGSGQGRDAGHGRVGEVPPAPDPLDVTALDSHCHLDLMGGDPAEVIAAARAVGVTRVVQVGIDVASSRWSAELAAARDDVWATVAIHPNEAGEGRVDETAWQAIADLAAQPRVVAIGETGLDHYRTGEAGRPLQEESFRRHIDIAKRTGRALMIHDRDAHDDVLRVLDSEGAPEHVVFHCFSGDEDFARRCIQRGHVLSFAGNVTFKNAQNLRDAVAITPLEQMLVETDAPFLTPTPYRGRPNAPHLVPITVRAIATVRDVGEEAVAAGISATAARVFGWP